MDMYFLKNIYLKMKENVHILELKKIISKVKYNVKK
jgi:hypothetical protein